MDHLQVNLMYLVVLSWRMRSEASMNSSPSFWPPLALCFYLELFYDFIVSI